MPAMSAAITTIEPGSTGAAVRDVQNRLTEIGLSCADDAPGVYGPATEAAVRTFQQQRGLTADGLVGAETWRSLVEAGRSLGDRRLYLTEPMLRGDDVRDLQRRLNRLGFNAGLVDGVFGEDAAGAVREFQLNAGLRVDGIVGGAVVSALQSLHRQHQSSGASTVREKEALRHAPRRPSLAGARLMIDPGHGPDDPGAVGPGGRPEHEVCWELASRLEGRLLARGVSVVVSRGPGTTPSPSQRARLANAESVDVVLSIHLNSLGSSRACGAAAYYFGEGEFASVSGRRLADRCVDEVVAATGTPHCRAHPSAVTLLRETRAPTVIVEPGFITHPDEGRLLEQPEHQERIVDALTSALTAHLTGVESTPVRSRTTS